VDRVKYLAHLVVQTRLLIYKEKHESRHLSGPLVAQTRLLIYKEKVEILGR